MSGAIASSADLGVTALATLAFQVLSQISLRGRARRKDGTRVIGGAALHTGPRPGQMPDAAEAQAPSEPAKSSAGDARFPQKLLVADDNKINQMIVGKMLQDQGCEVIFADDGEHAVSAFVAQRPDLVLMDISMPVMSGFEAARAIRDLEQNKGLAATPIIALTANDVAQCRNRCIEEGMDAFLAKPLYKDTLIRTIQRTMNASPSD